MCEIILGFIAVVVTAFIGWVLVNLKQWNEDINSKDEDDWRFFCADWNYDKRRNKK